ncbi:hypothetical protein A6M27_00260 [Acidithiobacillus thiooxidans]|uniref:Helix-turn-helix domain-containing protein n=1 Tax=Acidithiobacillus thiooxidans TaxID=930 RepID=A0A1C2J8Z2_ACITH|nr:hypothetical protein [Acidithiobacillus thiooxidans]OCX77473.1 hypothetical protein A6P07_00045 [Acidithiobacillus thiooxidans]OCX78346.1 hypothetical protein A6O24_04675 [Acidithiobacillus thiooxidans]OCX84720.1 hypothetical protein A6O26_03560 [Acidithiobacillus thiooxidans]OCX89690.1 hypothetical protein A6M27_00260 [Acidithiobacillus thiooxidans]OFC41988.1 hypothetical protein BAE47_16805 [Acidithiobacillus thiooxidans]
MKDTNTPGAWAIFCAKTYLYVGVTLCILLVLAWLVQLDGVPTDLTELRVIAALLLVVLAAGRRDAHAKVTGNEAVQAEEKQAWAVATTPIRDGYQIVRRAFHSEYPDYLREMGATGIDLVTHAHKQQSAGRQSGRKAGGHKKPVSSGSDDSDGGEPPASLPLLCTVHDLAVLLQVSPKTLQNKPQSALPPAVFIPGCRGPRYHYRDVIAWLNSFPVGGMKPPRKSTGKRGRPRIATSAQIATVRGKGV